MTVACSAFVSWARHPVALVAAALGFSLFVAVAATADGGESAPCAEAGGCAAAASDADAVFLQTRHAGGGLDSSTGQPCTLLRGNPYGTGTYVECCSGLEVCLNNWWGSSEAYYLCTMPGCTWPTPVAPTPAPPCTAVGQDPYQTGSEVPCCGGLQQCLKNWNGGSNWFYKCYEPGCNPPAPAPTPRPPTQCTTMGEDPYRTGSYVPCCQGLERCNGNWDNNGRWFYLCYPPGCEPTTKTPTPKPTLAPPAPTESPTPAPMPAPTVSPTPAPTGCTGEMQDPYGYPHGKYVPCCEGLEECLKDWNGMHKWFYKCTASCSGRPTPKPTAPPSPSPTAPPSPSPTAVPSPSPTAAPSPAPKPGPSPVVPTPVPAPDPGPGPLPPVPTAAPTEALNCTPANTDPYMNGNFLPCCKCAMNELNNWDGGDNYFFKCMEIPGMSGCGNGPEPLPWECATTTAINDRSIWTHLSRHPSCTGWDRTDASGQCVNPEGAVDHTSITLNLQPLEDKTGCFVWDTSDCKFSMKETRHIEFDIEWEDCDGVWFAPLWLVSLPWKAPQGTSGEIDLLETCRGHPWTIRTSIICRDHPHPECFEPLWGEARGSLGPQHFFATIEDDGTWKMVKCNIDRTNCELVSRYPNYLDTVYPTKDGRDNPFHFVSDIYNGGSGDAGWRHCGNLNYTTTCRYKVANIRITANTGADMFAGGRCAVLNK